MIEQLTPLEQHRANVRTATLSCLNVADHMAQSMANAYTIFWGAPTEIVLEMINSNIAHWLDVLQRNTAVGSLINAQLDAAALPEYPHRVPLTMPAGYAFTGAEFTYTAPVEPVPEEPQPIENDT